jgi:mRNA-degrading endonuclease RelE of RelBE toxin-antitoxin system
MADDTPAPLLADAPLHELARDHLAAFLLNAFQDDELLELLRAAKVATSGGYRLESLNAYERADLLADEIRAVPTARKPVIDALVKLYEFPAMEHVALVPDVAHELALLSSEPDASVRLMWRVLADPELANRKSAVGGLDLLADAFYGEPEAPAPLAGPPAADAPKLPAPTADERELRKEARRAGQAAERAREKAGALKEQLRAARTEQQSAEREAAQKGKEAARLARDLEDARRKLEAARKKGRADELEKLEKERGELAHRVAVLDEKVKTAAEARAQLEEELTSAKRQLEHKGKPEAPKPAEEAEAVLEAVPTTWLFPRFTREFYDSLEKWEGRIQRAAFKQAMLLAENHRHPSLRAIPLEGLPGYYRVRIATDVRLIYRRSENEREVELLSLIDREDLDRYVRQAKTR